MNLRVERLREEIKREISDILRRFKDPRIGFVTVTDVELSRDLEHAKVFVSVLGTEEEKEETMKTLTAATGYVRSELGQRIRIRRLPELVFVYDHAVERGVRITQILHQLHAQETAAPVSRVATVAFSGAGPAEGSPPLSSSSGAVVEPDTVLPTADWSGDFAPPAVVLEALRRARRPLIACHEQPDPDAVGSMLALGGFLRALGAQPTMVCPDPLSRSLFLLPEAEQIVLPAQLDPLGPWDVGIVVDCDPIRTAAALPYLQQRTQELVNIDHHGTNDADLVARWVRPEAAACGELIYAVGRALGVPLNPTLATQLFAALSADTGSFRFSNTRPRTLRLAAALIEAGAPAAWVSHVLFEEKDWNYVRLIGAVVDRLQLSPDGRVAWASLPYDLIQQSGVPENELDGFVSYPRMVGGVEVAMLLREIQPGTVRISLRSHERVDVSQLAVRLGGGGHPRAAGCTVAGSLEEVERRAVELAQAAVNQR
ncbi:MAG: 30S ribosome-binding factor RbfA [Limnochordaceae bacterium]|nr:30S ribosome-binding factor RbfA [Limnochordaceae bacterium]